jgi:photosystem II protein
MLAKTLAALLLAHVAAFRVPAVASIGSARPATRPPACTMLADEAVVAKPEAYIEFIEGLVEPCVPDVSLTRSRDGSTGVATFTFDNPAFIQAETQEMGETSGMILTDSEGVIKTAEVTATFTNGKPRIVKAVVVMKDTGAWDRFMRFMERYAAANGLGFSKA